MQRQEIKKLILKFAREFAEELAGEGDGCGTLCGQYKMCCSRAVGVRKETCSAVSAETRHKHVAKLLQSYSACLLSLPYLSAAMTGSGAPARDLLKLLSGPGGQHWCWESDGPGLRNCISAESYQRAHKVGKRAGQH